MKKICSNCDEELPFSEFGKKKKAPDGLSYWCKPCMNARKKEWYQNNKEKHKKRVAKAKEKHKKEIGSKVRDYLLENPCVDCGEADPIVLEFDHIRGEKVENIARLVTGTYSWNSIEKEIEKCEVVCANCHVRRTADQFGWYEYLGI